MANVRGTRVREVSAPTPVAQRRLVPRESSDAAPVAGPTSAP